ncbi:Lsr2 family protein [Streptosporangium sp. NBC_01755]|uniref:histone-like nucleoid-structuring protein Lsr2 n=1 Tax=unclassified Streptosporangium TaxID=2632669 RepID=UPI002DD8EDD1|nr:MULTISPECIES: Lsr2 family protein [unclassified Streptosporangium]WSA25479.1 Lsr2 family protein [Streptosporangium sp. NBC_01810]WSD03132.1 Lsr2 family protein [Streptosporangium sp. NBC_01755]
MAKQIQEILIDDLDGGEANETVAFAIDGTSYEIDLSDVNAKKLRDSLSPFVQSARRSSALAPRRRRAGGARALTREKSADIRAWAKSHGLNVSERGRIASSVVEQYEAAH